MMSRVQIRVRGIRAEKKAGFGVAELELLQKPERGEECLSWIYAAAKENGEVALLGRTGEYSMEAVLDAAVQGEPDIPGDCLERFESPEEAQASVYGSFYAMALQLLESLNAEAEAEMDLPDVEEEEEIVQGDFRIPETKEGLYRLRLSLETDVQMDSVFHDQDLNSFAYEKQYARALAQACTSESDYAAWKKSFIETAFPAAKNRTMVVCNYIFNGYGHYDMILPMEELHPFQGWLMSSGGMDAGMREATDEEIRRYIAMNAAR